MIALGPITNPPVDLSHLVGQRVVLELKNRRVIGASGQAVVQKVDGDIVTIHAGGSNYYLVSAQTVKKYVLVTTPPAAIGRQKR